MLILPSRLRDQGLKPDPILNIINYCYYSVNLVFTRALRELSIYTADFKVFCVNYTLRSDVFVMRVRYKDTGD